MKIRLIFTLLNVFISKRKSLILLSVRTIPPCPIVIISEEKEKILTSPSFPAYLVLYRIPKHVQSPLAN